MRFDFSSCSHFMNKEPRKVREFRRREQEILDTALKLFLEQGEDSVTVEMIADAVGIGKGTIYKHFKSKAEVYLRLMLDYERDLNALFHSEDVARDKEALSRAYFEFRMRDPQRYRLFDRLEEKVVKGNQVPEMVEQLHQIRTSTTAPPGPWYTAPWRCTTRRSGAACWRTRTVSSSSSWTSACAWATSASATAKCRQPDAIQPTNDAFFTIGGGHILR
jgi:AcrR family transcriptional regulator